ncbi:MAG: hydroxymethylglutaryl-CoA lyase, partial [Candidatus Tectomicrobia bacterium]|nr:hydroxymethylglutaryl-CoA lyase [Candidatus Tectomicrobia bacterium]
MMSDIPKTIVIREVGPREGFQIESAEIPTGEKVRLVDALSETGLRHIEVTSFVSPKWVPQMADAEEVAARFQARPGVSYTALYLNERGFERVRETGKFALWGHLGLAVSEAFSQRNTNRTIAETLASFPAQIVRYQELGLRIKAGLMATFGCNFEGDVPLELVVGLVQSLVDLSQ